VYSDESASALQLLGASTKRRRLAADTARSLANLRRAISETIEYLIDVLDTLDGDTDAEDGEEDDDHPHA
jgi:hypothetical protein